MIVANYSYACELELRGGLGVGEDSERNGELRCW